MPEGDSPEPTPDGAGKTVVIVVGVSGSGKTTVGQTLAGRLGWSFAEADDFHPAENVAKMTAGTPLTDEDRWPWLERIRDWIDANPGNAVVTCSALRRSYRDILRAASARFRFLHLHGSVEELSRRLSARTDHFMSVTMLNSQLATLEPLGSEEDGVVVSIADAPQRIADQAAEALGLL
jgi:gluconokinase